MKNAREKKYFPADGRVGRTDTLIINLTQSSRAELGLSLAKFDKNLEVAKSVLLSCRVVSEMEMLYFSVLAGASLHSYVQYKTQTCFS